MMVCEDESDSIRVESFYLEMNISRFEKELINLEPDFKR
jgi:hypothetical protein